MDSVWSIYFVSRATRVCLAIIDLHLSTKCGANWFSGFCIMLLPNKPTNRQG